MSDPTPVRSLWCPCGAVELHLRLMPGEEPKAESMTLRCTACGEFAQPVPPAKGGPNG